jgi:hypothetical protein
MKTIYTSLNDATARLGIVISIAGAVAADDALSDDLNDFLAQQTFEEIEDCLGKLPDDLKDVWEFDEEICDWAIQNNKLGFIVEIHTPDMSRGHFSWGNYFTKWVYGDSFEEAVAKGLEWVASVRAKEQAKADQEGGA